MPRGKILIQALAMSYAIWHAEVMPTTREYVTTRIRETMKTRKVSQNELADLSGVPASSLSRYMRGLTSPTLDHLARIADALNVPLADLMPARAA